MKFKSLYLTESEQPLQFSLSKKLNVSKFEFKKADGKFIIKTLTIPEEDVIKGNGVRAMLEIFKYCDNKNYDVVIGADYTNFINSLGLDEFLEGVRVQVALVLVES